MHWSYNSTTHKGPDNCRDEDAMLDVYQPIVQLPLTRESNFCASTRTATALCVCVKCIVWVCACIMTIRTNLSNIHVCTRQWLPTLKPKSYSLVKGNQTIEAVCHANLKLAIVELGGLMDGEVSFCNASNFTLIVVKASVAQSKTHH